MRAKTLAFVVVLVASATAAGQITGPETVRVRVGGRSARIVVNVNLDELSAKYSILGDAVDGSREYEPDNGKLIIRVSGLIDGGIGYLVVSGSKNGKAVEHYICTINVGQREPPPSPKPPEPPPPIPVEDPLVVALRDAAASDGMTKGQLREVAIASSSASMIVAKGKTAKQTHDAIKVALSKSPKLGAEVFKIVDGITGQFLSGLLSNPDEVVDEAKAELVKAPFVRLAQALTEAAK